MNLKIWRKVVKEGVYFKIPEEPVRKKINRYKPSWPVRLKNYLLKNPSINIANFFTFVADTYRHRTAVVLYLEELDYSFAQGRFINYLQMEELIGRTASAFKKMGLNRGDAVVIYMRNRIEIFTSLFGAMRGGFVGIPVNPLFKKRELEYIVEDSGARLILTDAESIDYIGGEGAFPPRVKTISLDSSFGDEKPFKEIMEEVGILPPVGIDLKKHGDDPAAILYTSGTTGFPKGATMTIKNLSYIVKRAMRIGAFFPVFPRGLGINAQPLSHIMGIDLMLLGLLGAIPTIFVSKFDAKLILDIIEREKVTIFVGVPTMYKLMLREGPEKWDLSSIRLYGSAADVMPPDLMEKFRQFSKKKIGPFTAKPIALEEYGQVETGGFIAFKLSVPFLPYTKGQLLIRAPHVKVKLFDEAGKPIRFWQVGKVGEICVKGKTVMKGYLVKGKLKRDNFYGDWLRTGDLARKTLFGFKFVGREKDRLKVGGYSVFPAEVEEELRAHPAIEDAVVFPVPHEVKGEIPVAAVKLKDGSNTSEDEIMKWVKENIAPYKAPRKIVFVEDFPRNLTLKVLRNQLSQKYAHLASQLQ